MRATICQGRFGLWTFQCGNSVVANKATYQKQYHPSWQGKLRGRYVSHISYDLRGRLTVSANSEGSTIFSRVVTLVPSVEYDTWNERARCNKESSKVSRADACDGKRDQKDTSDKYENNRGDKMETSFTETV